MPFTLTPSVFPVELFKFAQAVQRDLNEMVDAVSCDHEFITQVLGKYVSSGVHQPCKVGQRSVQLHVDVLGHVLVPNAFHRMALMETS